MKKMVISLVIEGNEEDLHTIKGNIISSACEALVSVSANVVEEPKKEIDVSMMYPKMFGGFVHKQKGGEMKAFVYNKKDNKTIAIITNVTLVRIVENYIQILDGKGFEFVYDKKEVKTRIYQN